MPHALNAILVLIGASAIAAGGYTAFRPAPVPTIATPAPRISVDADDQRVVLLQNLAETSCRCERRAGPDGKRACWAEFDRQMPPEKTSPMGSPCLPVSTGGRCEPSPDDGDMAIGQCVTTEYTYYSDNGPVALCSKAEASAVEKLYEIESARPDAKARTLTPMTDKLVRDILAGRPIPQIIGPRGCASS